MSKYLYTLSEYRRLLYMWRRYNSLTAEQASLYRAYKNPSQNKWYAWMNIQHEASHIVENIRDVRPVKVLTYNSMVYTCGYAYYNDNGQEIFVFHTPSKRYEVPVEILVQLEAGYYKGKQVKL